MPDRRHRGTLLAMQTEPIHPAVRIGHVHLRVADLDRSIADAQRAQSQDIAALVETGRGADAVLASGERYAQVYDAGGEIRRTSVAEILLDGCRISVELVEEVSTADLERLLVVDPAVEPEER